METMSSGQIADEWIRRLLRGEIRYDPGQVQSRWVRAPGDQAGRFMLTLNAGRKARLEQKAG